jgi:uncharacterized protein YndB with AHSA1/START domain
MRRRDIRACGFVRASAGRVYEALTSERGLKALGLEEAEAESRNLGRFRFRWPWPGAAGTADARGRFVDLDPSGKVAWLLEGPCLRDGLVPPLASFFLEKRPGGCRVAVLHAGFPQGPEADAAFAEFSALWRDCLLRLKRLAGKKI